MSKTHQEKNVQKWFKLIKDYLKSGMNREHYCNKHGIDSQRILYWLGRYYEVSKELIPAKVVDSNVAQIVQPQSACIFKLASGHEISVNGNEALTPELTRLIKLVAMTIPHEVL